MTYKHINIVLVACLVLLGPAWGAETQEKPNILFILVDDQGWSDLAVYGNPVIQTPAIDQLAREGVRFTNAYADPVCAPTRAALQTGQYPARLKMTGIPNPHQRPYAKLVPAQVRWQLPLEYTTLAEALADAGYVSGLFGKWHLGYKDTHQPEDQGYVYPEARDLAGPYRAAVDSFVAQNPYKGLGAQFLQSVRFIEQNRDKPFFCFVSYNMVHTALEARPALTEKYKKIVSKTRTVIHPQYAAMCETIDESVALFDDVLKALGLHENTVVIYYSDNGGVIEERGFLFHGYEEVVTHNWPLRSEKGSLFEGGIRVPLIVRWPGHTAPGTVADAPVMCVDFLPTFLDFANGKLPKNQTIDGQSFVPALLDGTMATRDIFWHYPHYHHSRPASAIRSGDYKLIWFYENESAELYNLAHDIGEQYNVAEEEPEVARRLKAKLDAWLKETQAELPTENPAYNYDLELLWGPRMKNEAYQNSNKKYGL
jgi:uncharacterized sulfatase